MSPSKREVIFMIAFFQKKNLRTKQNKYYQNFQSSKALQTYYHLGASQTANLLSRRRFPVFFFFANYSNKVKRKLDFVQLRNEFHEFLIVSLIILDPNNHLPFHFDN